MPYMTAKDIWEFSSELGLKLASITMSEFLLFEIDNNK